MKTRIQRRKVGAVGPSAASFLLALAFAAGPGQAYSGDETHPAPPSGAAAEKPDVKGPLREVLHCPLAFAGIHLKKDDPKVAAVAYHFCKPVDSDVNQCILYDGTGPNARLIGVEYLVTDAIYQAMPPEEKAYWHHHTYEVDAKLLKSLTQEGEEEKKTLAVVRTLWGKVFHTWVEGEKYPIGTPKLFWAVTGEAPFVLPKDAKLPAEIGSAQRRSGKDATGPPKDK